MTDHLPGAETFFADGGPLGVLVLHGFTSVPGSMRTLAKRLAAQGHAVALPLLPGHGATVEALQASSYKEWLACATTNFEALRATCERVAIVGLSMGATLGAALAVDRDDVDALVVINPQLVRPVAVSTGLEELLAAGVDLYDPIGGDIKKEGTFEPTLPNTPLRALKTLFDALDPLHARLHEISTPTLLLSSREDHLVAPSDGDALEAAARGPLTRVWLENSYHVATLDNDAEFLEEQIIAFLAKEYAL
jgi:carboxylesterase